MLITKDHTKILKVRTKSVIYDANDTMSLRYVMAQRFKKNGYTHVQIQGKVYETYLMSGIVWIED